MSKEALDHLHQLRNGATGVEVNCATTTLAALSRHMNPRREFFETAFEGVFYIEDLAAMIAIEWYENRNTFCHIYGLTEGSLEAFYRWAHRVVRHEQPSWQFVGGLYNTAMSLPNGDRIKHVVAVTGLHTNGKATIVDTAPTGINPATPYVRKVRLARLDDKLHVPDWMLQEAFVLFGEPLDSPRLQPSETQAEIEEAYESWQLCANDSHWFATVEQRRLLEEWEFD